MVQEPVCFGPELRRRRLTAGLTLTGLSKLVHYSKGQLSKVERGLKMPSRELARLCDSALDAGDHLAALVDIRPTGAEDIDVSGSGEEVWLMQLSGDGESWFRPLSRRQVMAMGVGSVASMSIGRSGIASSADTTLLGMSRALFDHYRQLGQVSSPALVLPALIAQTHSMQELSSRTRSGDREGLLRLASRYAEYTGWMMQEAGNDQAALWWTQRAVDLAAMGGDGDLAAYGHVRRALVTLYRDDAAATIELSQQAQSSRLPHRIRGLAAQREAQGHALAGDYDACMRSLDRARTLLAQHPTQPNTPIIGTTNLSDPVGMITGWCLHDLGRPQAAAETIGRQIALVPPQALRTNVRYGMRHALAHAVAGEIEHACHLAGQLLGSAMAVSSATIAQDMRALARTLARHPKNPAVRELTPELGWALQAVSP
ncbi:helix-turn-helix domain-containing protein [Streptosporangium subroseum]|uniref:helix-turn-helix domain-containing protein n=1 Tax=Streptosporangium subroseum TaxID=106412 RepID=UPI003092F8AE|nr:helix-turn-helix domain-containing protein [Streptosporangium subroseum]